MKRSADNAVAHRTLGRFELVERIGIGAFGEVWTAHDSELDRTVAVKIPRKDQLTAEEAEAFLAGGPVCCPACTTPALWRCTKWARKMTSCSSSATTFRA